ncbi:chaperone protein dnaJ 20, chloroplastic-like [Neltuma alba]|uniref:chaperone protein dnaJ 20, chloroplastic-like n=1 Tax=Neltuma alba TaxID=207710 RepID=UPI0010A4AE3A|nr:chaperone protein dnaJ 20, chloroplastic-like [Prosopis alba]
MLCNRLSTVSGSDSRFFYLPNPPISSPKSFKFSSIRLPSRSASFQLKVACVAEPLSSADELSFYELLGIPKTGSLPDIKQAYKQLARKYHPDVSPPGRVDDHTKMFVRIHEAYETLSDPSRRALYDSSMGLHSGGSYYDHAMAERKKEWRSQWQAQLAQLQNRTTNKRHGDRSQLWAARVRRQRSGSFNEAYN